MRKLSTEPVGEVTPTVFERAAYELPDGRIKTLGIVHRPPAVGVLPLRRAPGGEIEVFLAVQPRPAVHEAQLTEVVAGKMDPGEVDPCATASRELAEEVGLAAEHWQLLQAGLHVSPGYTTERIHLVLAWHCSIVPSRPEGDDITGHWIPLNQALRDIDTDLITELKTITALLLTQRRLNQHTGQSTVATT